MLNNTFYANTGQNTFTLSSTPINDSDVVVLYNGIIQLNTSYQIANNILTLNNNALANDVIQVQEDLTVTLNPSIFAYYGA